MREVHSHITQEDDGRYAKITGVNMPVFEYLEDFIHFYLDVTFTFLCNNSNDGGFMTSVVP